MMHKYILYINQHKYYDLKSYYLSFQVLVISFWYFSEAYGVKKSVLAVDLIFYFSERKEKLVTTKYQ